MNRRLFMQLLVFLSPVGANADALAHELAALLRKENTQSQTPVVISH